MVRVPGTDGSLETAKNKANVKVVLSSEDALHLAKDNPDKEVVFAAVGFETTTPATAVAINDATTQGVKNFSVLSAHKLVIPAMEALLTEKNNKIDAFLCPGHVSVIIGSDAYLPIVKNFQRPCVVAGFEPVGIIESIAEICRQLTENAPAVSSLYDAAVSSEGNTAAQKIINDTFDIFEYDAEPYNKSFAYDFTIADTVPAGTYPIAVNVYDSDSLSNSETLDIVVINCGLPNFNVDEDFDTLGVNLLDYLEEGVIYTLLEQSNTSVIDCVQNTDFINCTSIANQTGFSVFWTA